MSRTLSAMPWMVEKASKLAEKFESNPTAYTRWVNATFPQIGHFLRTGGPNCNVRIVVLNEASAVLHEIEPDGNAKTVPELKLVRSDDYRFRLASSSSFETTTGVMTLFKCLAAHLEENGRPGGAAEDLLYSFDYFTRSERDCPGLGHVDKVRQPNFGSG
jgi:hypothetical protein